MLMPALLCVAALGAVSCHRDGASISGRLAGASERPVILEETTASGEVRVDSVRTGRNGDFRIRIDKLPAGTTFYHLDVDGCRIPLFVSQGEHVRIESQYGKPADYTVTGSRESVLIKELTDLLNDGAARLDSLSRLISEAGDREADRETYLRAYAQEYSRLKREQIRFIVTNSGSLAALFALYQHLPNDNTLFNQNTDIVYYRMVADSVAKYYPDSPYLAALRSQIDRVDSNDELVRMMGESLCSPTAYPDLSLPDMYGKMQCLSDQSGKVILLDFWSAADPSAPLANAELKELYEEFAEQGLVIYQVGLDTSRSLWVNAVQEQALPWISVCDFKGIEGIAPRIYNVRSLPANYLIDREGEIVARNVATGKLREAVRKLL